MATASRTSSYPAPRPTLLPTEPSSSDGPPKKPATAESTTPAQGKKVSVGVKSASGELVPVWMDVDTAKFLIRALTAAVNQNIQPKKKGKS